MRWLTLTLLLLAAGTLSAEPVRLSAAAFGVDAEIEVRGQPRDAAAIAARDALHMIFEIGQLLDPSGRQPGSLGELNAAGGSQEPLLLEPRVAAFLRRGLQFCLWTNGAHGPLGGELYRLWKGAPESSMPDPTDLRNAVISAGCNRLGLELVEPDIRARLAPGSRLAAVGMGRGFALDRAADVLRAAGVDNAWLEVGATWRAMGPGPEGSGWLATLPPAPGKTAPIDQVWLRDQSLAFATIAPIGEEAPLRLLDQRTGVPPRGVVTVVVVTETAVDAEAVASTLFITGMREGHMRLGGLQPRPMVLWLLGQGRGEPLESTYRWSELDRVKRRF